MHISLKTLAFPFVLAFAVAIIALPLFGDGTTHAALPGATCTNGTVALRLELGEGIPLPHSYSNPVQSTVTFTLKMNANKFFGPAHIVGTQTLSPNRTVSTPGRVVPTTTGTPVGTDRVIIEVTLPVGLSGSIVVARCDYQLTLVLPAALQDLVQVPVRWCVVEGSPQAEGKKTGATVGGAKLLSLLQKVNDQIWVPEAHISFWSPISSGIPVIKDPSYTGGPGNYLGDIDALWHFESGDAMEECKQAWASRYPGQTGTILINVRLLTNAGPVLGHSPGAQRELWVTGQRGDDLCGQPRYLTVADVTSQYVAVVDQAYFGCGTCGYTPGVWSISGEPAQVLAHELGHTLLLGHGNGLDDNHDGTEPPNNGPRRYDEYCDPLGTNASTGIPKEESMTPYTTCKDSRSLMHPSTSGCTNLQPLQVEQARAVAKLVPGAKYYSTVMTSPTASAF
jgi:hypothetical protein